MLCLSSLPVSLLNPALRGLSHKLYFLLVGMGLAAVQVYSTSLALLRRYLQLSND